MATTTTSTTHSPRSSDSGSGAAAAINSPQSRRTSATRGVSSPWTQIVRGGGDSESIVSSPSTSAAATTAGAAPSPSSSSICQDQIVNSSDWSSSKAVASDLPDDSATDVQPESSESTSGGNNAAKKPVWNKPSNVAVEVSPVMGAVSWPALSESTRASPKSSSDSLKGLSDGSAALSQGTGIASSPSHKQVINNNVNPIVTSNHVGPTRQRSMKHGGGGSSSVVSANGGFPQPPPPSPGSVVEVALTNSVKPGPAAGESSSRDHAHKESGHRGGFGSHSGNDHQHQRNSFRRGNGGAHPRGDGSYHHHGYGGRRGQDHGNQDWNPNRSFSGRDSHMQSPRVVPRGFVRPTPHTSTPFVPPLTVRPFGSPMVYPEVASSLMYYPGPPPPESLRGIPIVAPISTMFVPVPDPQLYAKIVNQIDYYFSNENLIKDTFLRHNMDDQGWVPIKLIAGFKKVMYLTDNIQLILDALRNSTIVEVQGDKVRRRNDWMRWIMPPVQFPNVSSPQSLGRSNNDLLAAHFLNVTLEENLVRSSSGESSSQSQQSGSEGIGNTHHWEIQTNENRARQIFMNIPESVEGQRTSMAGGEQVAFSSR